MPAEEVGRVRLGACFCGGASRRMGRDKARLPVRRGDVRTTLLENAVSVLEPLADEVVLSVGPTPRYGELGLREIVDRRPGGPLAGLEAVLGEVGPDDWVAALACDLPHARGEVFRYLLAAARERGWDGCLLETEGGVEPLYAVYRGRCAAAVTHALDEGHRRMIAFHEGHGDVCLGRLALDELPEELAGCAHNVNTPADLAPEDELASLPTEGPR